jgi:hypothetical protein
MIRKDGLATLADRFDISLAKVHKYLRENANLIFALAVVALCAYGFELFQLNLTVDEELHAEYLGPTLGWVSQGRWGMYLLNKFILPYTIIPFAPLFVALIFHIAAALLMLEGWKVTPKVDRFIVGAICVAFPTMAYMYTFSTISYGIGIGLFCSALSLFLYARNQGWKRYLAILPASFAIAIYQGFLPVLAALFLVCMIHTQIHTEKPILFDMIAITGILIAALFIYYAIQRLIFFIGVVPGLAYVSDFFDVEFLRRYFGTVLLRIWTFAFLPVYLGDEGIYSIRLRSLAFLSGISFLGLFINLVRSKRSIINWLLVFSLLLLLLISPFLSGFLMQGYMTLRFLVALPVVIAGIVMLGMLGSSRSFKLVTILLATYCIFQFVTSTNRLFASSHLAFEADQILATRLITRIEDAQVEAKTQALQSIEIIGYYSRPATKLIPKIETFGASFFEVGQGIPDRVAAFLQIAGLERLHSVSVDRRAELVEIAKSMPTWPDKGSVKVVEDIVLIKFGPYSDAQKMLICSAKQSRSHLYDKSFCRP